jgi:hypothetical protein
MKLSELETLFWHYDEAKWSPSRMSVHFNCNCGCGGDRYTVESWDAEENAADETIKQMKQFCKNYNIEYDGIE